MSKHKVLYLFAAISSFCIVISLIFTIVNLDKIIHYNINEIYKKNIVSAGKNAVEELYYKIQNKYKANNQIDIELVLEDIRNEINIININNYSTKFYLIGVDGTYLVHYSKDYQGSNAWEDVDVNDVKYMKQLSNSLNDNSGFIEAKIKWTNGTQRHIITYLKYDERLQFYYGCTFDLKEQNSIKEYDLDDFKNFKYLIIGLTILFIFLIFLFTRRHLKSSLFME